MRTLVESGAHPTAVIHPGAKPRSGVPGETISLDLEDGEEFLTEVSCKYTRQSVERLLERAGLTLRHWLTDEDETYALSLSRLA